jgi:SET domain-containing protein
MVIEYIGELIRNEVANKREKLYEQQNRGIYMFRLDEEYCRVCAKQVIVENG